MTKREMFEKIEEIFEVESKKGKEDYKAFKDRLEQRRIETGIGYNKETGRIKSYTTLLKAQLKEFVVLLEEVVSELEAEEVVVEESTQYSERMYIAYNSKGELDIFCCTTKEYLTGSAGWFMSTGSQAYLYNQWALLDHVGKCQRAVEIIQEDFEAGVDAGHLEDLYIKGSELYGKAFSDAVPNNIKESINLRKKGIDEMNDLIFIKKVGQSPELKKVNLKDLKTLQGLVGGYIQTVPLPSGILLVCNEEGRILDLEPNMVVGGEVLVGDIFFCSYDSEDFTGLSEEQIEILKVNFALMEMGE